MITILTPPHRVKARKPHRCDWCGKRIEIGEEHTVSTNVGDGIYNWRECDRCATYVSQMMRMPDKFYFDDGVGGWTSESFVEFMREEYPATWEAWEFQNRLEARS